MGKFYAVKVGREKGIYNNWEDCKKQVSKFSGAVYKSFNSREEAVTFIEDKVVIDNNPGLIVYVDGSFNVKTNEYGYGCVFIDNQSIIKETNGKGNLEDYVSMRNVSGEILGCEVAVKYAIKQGYQDVYIYYDYEGIEKWAMGLWKANKVGTIAYVETMNNLMKQIKVHFIKVLAHSGDIYNERADKLAKRAVGIK